jgi:hypothetical protein
MVMTPEERKAARARTMRAYRERNPEKIRDSDHRYRERNKERISEVQHAYRERNRAELAAKTRVWYAGNRERALAYNRDYSARNRTAIWAGWLRRKHGMQPGEFAALWDEQDGRCYLCGEPLDSERVHTDHDHACCGPRRSCRACRRGLACNNCNVAIGLLAEDPDRLRRIADALEKAKASAASRKARTGEQLALMD